MAIRRNKECPECEGRGFVVGTGVYWDKCSRCKGLGRVKLTFVERTAPRKYGDVIQPIRDLANENDSLKHTLRSMAKKYRRTRQKRNKLVRQVKNQGQYIELLKEKNKALVDVLTSKHGE